MNQVNGNQKDVQALFVRSLLTGFIGGVFLGFFNMVMYFFNFSEITLKDYLWYPNSATEIWTGWFGNIFAFIIFGCISMAVALVYYASLRKINSFWIGFLYGACLWVVLFIGLKPLYPQMKTVTDWNLDTILSTLCLFLLYGIFIGYSISYDYYDTIILKQKNAISQSEK